VFVIEVGIDGSVKDVSIARSSGSALLDKAAVDCAKAHWRFRPALKDGKPVEASVKYAIKWRMEPPPR